MNRQPFGSITLIVAIFCFISPLVHQPTFAAAIVGGVDTNYCGKIWDCSRENVIDEVVYATKIDIGDPYNFHTPLGMNTVIYQVQWSFGMSQEVLVSIPESIPFQPYKAAAGLSGGKYHLSIPSPQHSPPLDGNLLNELYGDIRRIITGPQPPPNLDKEVVCKNCGVVAGPRGKPTESSIALTTASPAFTGGLIDLTSVSVPNSLPFEFMLLDGRGDAHLEVSFNGIPIWGAHASEFLPDTIYEGLLSGADLEGQAGMLLFTVTANEPGASFALLSRSGETTSVAEPCTTMLLVAGLACMPAIVRRRLRPQVTSSTNAIKHIAPYVKR